MNETTKSKGGGNAAIMLTDDGPMAVLALKDFLALVEAAIKPVDMHQPTAVEPAIATISAEVHEAITHIDVKPSNLLAAFNEAHTVIAHAEALNKYWCSSVGTIPSRRFIDVVHLVEQTEAAGVPLPDDIDPEDAADNAAFDAAMATDEESLPAAMVNQLIAGDKHPLRIWREHRGLTQTALADAAGVRQATISGIESGKIDGNGSTLKAIAAALDVTVDDILA